MTPPVFAHGHLRLYLLGLLAERPMHGYELIQALSDRFGGTYAPSAGTIYPRLARLEEEGLVTKQADGRRTVYAVTDAGRREVEFRRSELDGIEADVSDSVRRLADDVRASVDDAMRTLRADLAAAARDVRPEPAAARHEDPRVRSRMQLQRAEAALTEFRAQVRADLRREVVGGDLPEEAVDLLRRRLDDVRRELATALRR
jgi:DNA-binding PadR family transcriptional regulator